MACGLAAPPIIVQHAALSSRATSPARIPDTDLSPIVMCVPPAPGKPAHGQSLFINFTSPPSSPQSILSVPPPLLSSPAPSAPAHVRRALAQPIVPLLPPIPLVLYLQCLPPPRRRRPRTPPPPPSPTTSPTPTPSSRTRASSGATAGPRTTPRRARSTQRVSAALSRNPGGSTCHHFLGSDHRPPCILETIDRGISARPRGSLVCFVLFASCTLHVRRAALQCMYSPLHTSTSTRLSLSLRLCLLSDTPGARSLRRRCSLLVSQHPLPLLAYCQSLHA